MRTLVLMALLAPSLAHAWDRDVHYGWTWYLAVHAGYTERQAWQIASGVEAVDADRHTRPLAASAWELYRAGHVAPHDSEEAKAWRSLHCFADREAVTNDERAGSRRVPTHLGWVSFTGGEVEARRRARAEALWEEAVATGNPAALIHFEQDCVAHRDFDDTRGHAFAGTAPLWLSADRERALEVTDRTLEVLARFRTEVLGEPAKEVDRERVVQVLDQLLEENPVDVTGLVSPEGPANPLQWYEFQLQSFPAEQVIAGWDTISWKYGETFDPGVPSYGEALAVIAQATKEDKILDRLTRFPDEWWEPPPAAALAYDLDTQARPVGEHAEAWPVERVVLSTVQPDPVRIESGRSALQAVHLQAAYRLEGSKDLPAFLGVPVWESCAVGEDGQRVWKSTRTDGEHLLSQVIYRPAVEAFTWRCSIQPHGLPPTEVPVAVPAAVADTVDVPEALRDDRRVALDQAAVLASACQESADIRAGAATGLEDLEKRLTSLGKRVAALEEDVAALPHRPEEVHETASATVDASMTAAVAWDEAALYVQDVCAATDWIAGGLSSEEIEGLHAAAVEAVENAEHRRKEVHARVADATGHLAATREVLATISRPLAESRRVQDHVWLADRRLLAVERQVGDARRALGRAEASEPELAAAAARLAAADGSKEARAVGKEVSALVKDHGSCRTDELAALDEVQGRIRELQSAAAEMESRLAAVASELPTPLLRHQLDLVELDARVTFATVQAFPAEADAVVARGRACLASIASARKER